MKRMFVTLESLQKSDIFGNFPEVEDLFIFAKEKSVIPVDICKNFLCRAYQGIVIEVITYNTKEEILFHLGRILEETNEYLIDDAISVPEYVMKSYQISRIKKPAGKKGSISRKNTRETVTKTSEQDESAVKKEVSLPQNTTSSVPGEQRPEHTPEQPVRKRGPRKKNAEETSDLSSRFETIIEESGAGSFLKEKKGIVLTPDVLMQMVKATSKIDPDLKFQFKLNFGEELGYRAVEMLIPYYEEMKELLE